MSNKEEVKQVTEPMEEDEEGSDEDMGGEMEEESAEPTNWHAVTGRGVTLAMLLKDKVIEPGKSVLSIKYLGKRFTADLFANGQIRTNDTNEIYQSPSTWALHCKKVVNPDKKSGCGWASVKYKGQKLDTWKSVWCRRVNISKSPVRGSSPASDGVRRASLSEHKDQDATLQSLTQTVQSTTASSNLTPTNLTISAVNGDKPTIKADRETPTSDQSPAQNSFKDYAPDYQEEALNLSMKGPRPASIKEEKVIEKTPLKPSVERKPVKFSTLGRRRIDIDPNTLVKCETFTNIGIIQPFTITVATNAMLLMDYHCHLTTSEVVGYLGGKWDPNTQHLSIIQAFPCKCRLGDKENVTRVEDEIRHSMHRSGLTLVGWYHSHPHSEPEPSIKDIDSQMSYQLRMKGPGSIYYPCIGIIVSSYYKTAAKQGSTFQAYWIMPPTETHPSDYGVPMSLLFSTHQNQSLTEDLLSEMRKLKEFCNGGPDWVDFRDIWHHTTRYIDKLKGSLATKLPKDQIERGTFLDFVQQVLMTSSKT